MASQAWSKLVTGRSRVWKVGEGDASLLYTIKKPVRILRAVLGDIPPNVVEVALRFWSFQ